MADFELREYCTGDLPALKALWLDCFEEKCEYVEEFLSLLPRTGSAVAALCGAALCGSAYVLDDMFLSVHGKRQRCALIYAVAVDKSHRRLGMGEALVKRAVELAYERGAEIVTVLPAEDSLYGWYERSGGFVCRLYRQSLETEAADMAMVDIISPEEYAKRRQELIKGENTVIYGAACLELQQALCRSYGGALYSCAGAIAAAYADGDVGIIQELLYPEGMDAELFAAAVGFEMGVEQVRLLVPGDESNGKKYLAALGAELPDNCCWPLAFD